MHGRENDTVKVVNDVPKSDVALREEAIQEFWLKNDIFKRSIIVAYGCNRCPK